MSSRDPAAAERRRLCRARKGRKAMVVPPVAVPPAAIEALIDLGHLPAWDSNDRLAVHAALERYLQAAEVVTLSHCDGLD